MVPGPSHTRTSSTPPRRHVKLQRPPDQYDEYNFDDISPSDLAAIDRFLRDMPLLNSPPPDDTDPAPLPQAGHLDSVALSASPPADQIAEDGYFDDMPPLVTVPVTKTTHSLHPSGSVGSTASSSSPSASWRSPNHGLAPKPPLSAEQRSFLEHARKGGNIYVTGAAGQCNSIVYDRAPR